MDENVQKPGVVLGQRGGHPVRCDRPGREAVRPAFARHDEIVWLAFKFAAVAVGACQQDAAKLSRIAQPREERLRLCRASVVPLHESDGISQVAARGRLDQPFRLVHGVRHRLFRQHVPAGLQRIEHYRAGCGAPRHDHHGLHVVVVEQLAMRAVHLGHAELRCRCMPQFRPQFRQRRHAAPGQSDIVGDVRNLTDHACAYEADADLLCGPLRHRRSVLGVQMANCKHK